jgi:hypothetical protein
MIAGPDATPRTTSGIKRYPSAFACPALSIEINRLARSGKLEKLERLSSFEARLGFNF